MHNELAFSDAPRDDRSNIGAKLDQLSRALGTLDELSDSLVYAITPILAPSGSGDEALTCSPDVPSQSDIAHVLDQMITRVGEVNDRIADTKKRVEL